MKITKYFNWIFAGLCLINFVDAVINDENKEYDAMNIDERDSVKLPGLKRPFCNAFTGCGKKRNYVSEDTKTTVNDSMISIPLKLYQILMSNFNYKLRQNIDHQVNEENKKDDDLYYSFHKQPIRKRYN